MIYIIAFFSILAGAVAQFMLKMGVRQLRDFDGPGSVWRLCTDVWFLSGVAAYGVSLLIWLYVLSRLELSRAYPLVSLGYVLTMIMAWLWLGEALTWAKVVGMALIIIGVWFISR